MKEMPWLYLRSLLKGSFCGGLLFLSLLCSLLSLNASAQHNSSPTPPDQKLPFDLAQWNDRYYPDADPMHTWLHAVQPGYTCIAIRNGTHQLLRVTITKVDAEGDAAFFGYIPADASDKTCRCCGPEIVMRLPAAAYSVSILSENYQPFSIKIGGLSGSGYSLNLGMWKLKQGCAGLEAPVDPDTFSRTSQTSIRGEIDRIAGGTHQELPPPTQTSLAPGQNPGWTIENATGYQLHLYLSGPTERDYVIPNGNSVNIDLPAGDYRIAADVSDKSVIPFYAVRKLDANVRWTSHFYIAQSR